MREEFREGMREGQLEDVVIAAMRGICATHNATFHSEAIDRTKQNAAKPEGQPYDVGVILKDCYMVGLEFKVLDGSLLSSWTPLQHDAYVALTNNEHLPLPLFYAYNTGAIDELSRLLKRREHDEVLQTAKISVPILLPDNRPHTHEHLTLSDWLAGMLTDSEGMARNGWLSIFIADAGMLQRFEVSCPNIIWLLVSKMSGLRQSWMLTHTELATGLKALGRIRRMQELQELVAGEAAREALVNAVKLVSAQLKIIGSLTQQQQDSADEMAQGPEEESGSTFSPG
jgi:hypothetical protein